jgi:hypothetical protein
MLRFNLGYKAFRAFSVLIWTLSACASSSAPPDAGGGSLCSAMGEYAAQCHHTDSCTKASLDACPAHSEVLGSAYLQSATACYSSPYDCTSHGTAALAACLTGAQFTVTPTATQEKVRMDFCTLCPDGPTGAPGYCSQFFSGAANSLGGLVLPYSDAIAEKIDRQCTASTTQPDGSVDGGVAVLDCVHAFAQCARAAVPAASVACTNTPVDSGQGDSSLPFGP